MVFDPSHPTAGPHLTRRVFLQQSSLWASMLAMGNASAQNASDYKAIVCVFLNGGNDAYNTVLATDAASWANYTAVRTQQPSPIALLAPGTARDTSKGVGTPEWLGGVLSITPSTAQPARSFALHPRLTELQTLFNTHKRLAVIANIGPLVVPLSKEQYTKGTAQIPPKLYSHNDQQNSWQALAPEGATIGWGGQLADAWLAANSQSDNTFSAISAAGNAVWLSGQDVRQYQLSTSGAVQMGGSYVYGSSTVAAALKRIAGNTRLDPANPGRTLPRSSHVLAADLGAVAQRSIAAESQVNAALAATPTSDTRVGPDSRLRYTNLDGSLIDNSLARQLQVVARAIASQSALGVQRQVFFVSMGGFDTHDNQNRNHADLMAKLDHALAYFDETLDLLGKRNQVTTFTASDFGRTFTSNGDGTDHGWGAHHFVLGGAVRGGDIYGSFPTLGSKNSNNTFDSPDQLTNGALLPRVSVDQLGATLGRWFGLDDAQLGGIFTHLRNFNQPDLGFMQG